MNATKFLSSTPCRCCGQPMWRMFQVAFSPKFQVTEHEGQRGYFLTECHNPDCVMNMQTVNEDEYATLDLSAYMTKKGA